MYVGGEIHRIYKLPMQSQLKCDGDNPGIQKKP